MLAGYEPIGGPTETACEVGVFLSSDDEDVEDSLTRAEPPAHDEWRVTNAWWSQERKDHRWKNSPGNKICQNRLAESVPSTAASSAGSGEQNVSRGYPRVCLRVWW